MRKKTREDISTGLKKEDRTGVGSILKFFQFIGSISALSGKGAVFARIVAVKFPAQLSNLPGTGAADRPIMVQVIDRVHVLVFGVGSPLAKDPEMLRVSVGPPNPSDSGIPRLESPQ